MSDIPLRALFNAGYLGTVPTDKPAVTICYGPPMKEIHRETIGERWCFVCHKRREFFYIVTAPIEVSYYGPNPGVKCETCSTSDGDLFPGRVREWEDY